MPIFELDIKGKPYEIEAPDMDSAIKAVGGFNGIQQSTSPQEKTDALIASRPNAIEETVKARLPWQAQGLLNLIPGGNNLATSYNAAQAVGLGNTLVQSALTNPALALKKDVNQTNPVERLKQGAGIALNPIPTIAKYGGEIVKGLTGQKRGEYGDITRSTGFGENIPIDFIPGGGKNLNELIARTSGLGIDAALGSALMPKIPPVAFREGTKLIKSTAGEIVGSAKGLGNKVLRGGLNPQEVSRIESEYGNNVGNLVDKVKRFLGFKAQEANTSYMKALASAPEGKQINIRPAIEEAGKRLKKLGLITEKGNLTELGNSEIAQDSVYGKLLDFYRGANAISGVEKLESKTSLTPNQIVKAMKAQRETLVNVDQYTFFRDKLNNLYKNKPSDVDVSKVVNQFYQDGENSGIKGLQKARELSRKSFEIQDRFIDSKGDLKIANEAKLSKLGVGKLSKQDLDHIKEIEDYIGQPIASEAEKINKINRSFKNIRRAKDMAIGGAITALGLGGVNKLRGD